MLDKPERDALGRGAAEWSIQWRWLLIPLTVLAVIAVSYGASTLSLLAIIASSSAAIILTLSPTKTRKVRLDNPTPAVQRLVADATSQNDNVREAALKFAASSGDLSRLSQSERRKLNDFVKVLAAYKGK